MSLRSGPRVKTGHHGSLQSFPNLNVPKIGRPVDDPVLNTKQLSTLLTHGINISQMLLPLSCLQSCMGCLAMFRMNDLPFFSCTGSLTGGLSDYADHLLSAIAYNIHAVQAGSLWMALPPPAAQCDGSRWSRSSSSAVLLLLVRIHGVQHINGVLVAVVIHLQ
jgi:hypothetical protein